MSRGVRPLKSAAERVMPWPLHETTQPPLTLCAGVASTRTERSLRLPVTSLNLADAVADACLPAADLRATISTGDRWAEPVQALRPERKRQGARLLGRPS